jgi:hypothetical protein
VRDADAGLFLDSTGSNDYRGFNGYKDDGYNGASFSYHSCVKVYYYV